MDPDFSSPKLMLHRDSWVMLFRVDYDLDALELDDRHFANLS